MLNNRNSHQAETIRTYNQRAKQYMKNTWAMVPNARKEFAAELPQGSLILDAGCAGGRDSKFFLSKRHKVIGIDISKEFIKEARKRVPAAHFIQMDLTKLKLKSESFDGVWANASLLHLQRKQVLPVLKSFYKILKPGGLLDVKVKKGTGEAVIAERLSGGFSRYFTFFSKREVEKLFRQAGFRVIFSDLSVDPFGRSKIKWITVWGRKPSRG
jgi:ubiquinone/menaquinone biosynthesis C-methylase UbiE